MTRPSSGDISLRPYLVVAVLLYFVLVGGTDGGFATPIRAANTLLGAALIALWARGLWREADLTDALVLGGLLLFLVACVTSLIPRYSLSAATTLLGYAAAFGVARRELADQRTRRLVVVTLGALATVLIIIFGVAWTIIWAQWIGAHGTLPPLDLQLTSFGILRYKYLVAILIVMLVPVLMASGRLGIPGLVRWPLVAVSSALVVMSGARSAWLAIPFALVAWWLASGAPRPRSLPRRWLGALAVLLLAVGLGVIVSGALGSLLDRAFAGSSVSLRFAIWGHALESFWQRPLVGSGPGTFPTMITLSGFFQHFESLGRQPDSAPVQLLSEAGLLGAAGFALAAGGAVLAIGRNPNSFTPYAVAGAVAFFGSALTNDTADSANHIGIMVVLAALAGPAMVQPAVHRSAHGRWTTTVRIATVAAALVVAVASGAVVVAQGFHDAAVTALERGDQTTSRKLMEVATALDPAYGLYRRELGSAELVAGHLQAARTNYEHAVTLSPGDLVAERMLALTAARQGDAAAAVAHAARAADLQPTEEMNLDVYAWVTAQVHSTEAPAAMSRLLRQFPWLPGTASWGDEFATGNQLAEALHLAQSEAARAGTPGLRELPQRVFLAAETGTASLATDPGYEAVDALLRCDVSGALAAADQVSAMKSFGSWDLMSAIMVYRATGQTAKADDMVELARLRVPAIAVWATNELGARSPLDDQVADDRIYQQRAGVWPMSLAFPTSNEALSAWLRGPVVAAMRGAPGSGLAACVLSR